MNLKKGEDNKRKEGRLTMVSLKEEEQEGKWKRKYDDLADNMKDLKRREI